ncbi:MAG: hypothetical protein ACJA06_000604 [Halocynthiibacter sp.]|jgi:hypothetical protein
MSYLVRISLCSALALGAASTAFADIEPQDVWDVWQEQFAHTGQTLTTGSVEAKRKLLTIRDISTVMESETNRTTMQLEQIEMRALRGGKVEIIFSPQITLSSMNTLDDDNSAQMQGTISLGEHRMIASGDPEQISYEIEASTISIDTNNSIDNGVASVVDMDVTLEGVTGVYETAPIKDGMLPAHFDILIAKYSATAVSTVKAKDTFKLVGALADYKVFGDIQFPQDSAAGGVGGWLGAGAIMDAKASTGAGSFDFEADAGAKSAQGTFAVASSTVGIVMSDDSIAYSGDVQGISFTAKGPRIPVPEVSGALAQYRFGLSMPVKPSSEPKDFSLDIGLEDFTLGEDVWALFDPSKGLPRDPVQLDLALSGKGNWLVDIFDPEVVKDAGQKRQAPGALQDFAIDRLKLAVAGALLTGSGTATFNPDVKPKGRGFPIPDGTLNLALTGGYGLMGKLTEIGLLPADQAMGAQMMLGLFTKPGTEPDSLTTELKSTSDGALYANGQRFK